MRVSTSMIFSMGREAIQRQSGDFLHTQQQLASGRRIVKPSDDSVSSARLLELSQNRSVNLQHRENQGYARDALRLVDATLASVSDLLLYVRTRAVEAGNPTHGQTERNGMAADLRAQYERLRGLANTRDAEGNYLFAGYQLHSQPFAADISGPTGYGGDGASRALQVSAGRQMPVSVPGHAVFGGTPGDPSVPSDVFRDLATLISRLESGTFDTAADPQNAIGALDAALDRVLTERAAVGSRLVELDALESVSSDYELQFASAVSRLQDLDYAEGISRFSQQQTMLEAAQQSYVRMTGLSLFNFLR